MRAGGSRQPAALHRRDLLSHAVQFGDVGAALEHRLHQPELFIDGDAGHRLRHQRRGAARNERDEEIIGAERRRQRQRLLGGGKAGLVGNRVAGMDQRQTLQVMAVAVGGDDEALEWAIPIVFHRLRHGHGGLADRDHHGATPGLRRQVAGHRLHGVGSLDRGIEEAAQDGPVVSHESFLPGSLVFAPGQGVAQVSLWLDQRATSTLQWARPATSEATEPRTRRETPRLSPVPTTIWS